MTTIPPRHRTRRRLTNRQVAIIVAVAVILVFVSILAYRLIVGEQPDLICREGNHGVTPASGAHCYVDTTTP